MTHEIQIAHSTYLSTQIKKRISVGGIDVDEDFVKELLIKHLRQGDANDRPTLSDAFDIYMAENTSAHRRKFKLNANQYFNAYDFQCSTLSFEVAPGTLAFKQPRAVVV